MSRRPSKKLSFEAKNGVEAPKKAFFRFFIVVCHEEQPGRSWQDAEDFSLGKRVGIAGTNRHIFSYNTS